MFIVKKEKLGKLKKIKLFNCHTGEFISIIPGYGANIDKAVLRKGNKLYSILDGNKNSRIMKDRFFKGAKLAPFPNRIKNGIYHFNGKKYRLPINFKKGSHAVHGIVYNKKFIISKTGQNKNSCFAHLEYNHDGRLKGYPFKFLVTLTYILTKQGLACKTIVKNTGNLRMPFGDGWHHYFKLNGKINRLLLKLPVIKEILTDEQLIPTGAKKPAKKFLRLEKIGNKAMDSCFQAHSKKNTAKTVIYGKKEKLKITVWQETGPKKYNYLQVFIPPLRNSIAIEPMTCLANAFNNKEGLILLNPKEEFKAEYGVYLK